jgi:hypothetical protein
MTLTETTNSDGLGADTASCVMIAASCTTGWFDWVHGELWLCPTGLLRRSLGMAATIDHARAKSSGNRTLDPHHRPVREFSSAEIAAIQAADARNAWLPWSEIRAATLKRGIIDHSLHLELGDGQKRKFLWLKSDGGFDLLRSRLGEAMGDRLAVVDRPIG